MRPTKIDVAAAAAHNPPRPCRRPAGGGGAIPVILVLALIAAPAMRRAATAQEEPPEAGPATVELPPLEQGAALVIDTVSERLELPPASFQALRLAEGQLSIDESRTSPLADVLLIAFPWRPAPPRTSTLEGGGSAALRILLRGGDELSGAPTAPPGDPSDEDAFGLATPFGTFSLPLDAVRGAVIEERTTYKPYPRSEELRIERLRERILREAPEEDVLVLAEGGTMEGILERVGASGVRVSTDSLGEIEVGYGKLQGFLLAEIGDLPSEAPPDALVPDVRLVTRDESTLAGRLVSLADGQIALRHARLGEVRLALTDVGEIAVIGGRVRYLSDLEPSRTEERLDLAFDLPLSFRRDRNVLGGPLRMAGRRYRKGLGVHAYSLLEYDLAGETSRFQATIGLDESAAPIRSSGALEQAAVVFRIRVDGEQRFERALDWREAPVDVSIDVSGGKRLELEVDYGSGEEGVRFARDRANWASARLIR